MSWAHFWAIFVAAFDIFWLTGMLFFVAAQFVYGLRRSQRTDSALLASQASLLRANEMSSQAALESAHAASLLAHMLNSATTGASLPSPVPTSASISSISSIASMRPTSPPVAASPPAALAPFPPLGDLDKLTLDIIESADDPDPDPDDDEDRYGP